MFVPSLSNRKASELGHVNYQSPLREATHYGPYLDRFSAIVIAIALQALSLNPQFWDKYAKGENLLFDRSDFVDPDGSELLQDLTQVENLKHLIPQFKVLCRAPLEKLPTLEEFLTGTASISQLASTPVKLPVQVQMRQYEVIEAKETAKLRARVAQRIEVVGQIIDVARLTTRQKRPYAFVNFGDWRNGTFRLVLWEESLKRLQMSGQTLETFVGEWVSVVGLIQSWIHDGRAIPQIIIEESSQLQRLGGRGRALNLIAQGKQDQDHETASLQRDHSRTSRNSGVRQRLQDMTSPPVGPKVPNSNPSSVAQAPKDNQAPHIPVRRGPVSNSSSSSNQQVRQKLQHLGNDTYGPGSSHLPARAASKAVTKTQSSARTPAGNAQQATSPHEADRQSISQRVRTWFWWIIGVLFVLWILF